ncbi:PEP-CTERM/exosortase system-associated acyltransferase [Motiliproteus sediminis]|uniref:PEP-CTERM/exosortase system-associated acyltransferase n=1 Tax=Motiliproteus sediminis TaxID=1468178 RepID=UPI001AEFE3C6|nr:PEP-CTERM/exosortase system-associated acyltransferase [Motiliproteus sediminis]
MSSPRQSSICDTFNQYFSVSVATGEQVKEAYRIRYEVYARELGWEPPNSEGLEQDEYDDHAIHCLLQHKRTEAYAGCVRLISTSLADRVPFEDHCLESVDTTIIDPPKLQRGTFGEISRLAVPESFRRRRDERQQPFVINSSEGQGSEPYSEEERRNFPNIAMGLYLASIACVDVLGLDYVFVMMEPRLRRHLVRFGLPFKQAGVTMDYHGIRALFYLPKGELSSHFSEEMEQLYASIKAQVRPGLV